MWATCWARCRCPLHAPKLELLRRASASEIWLQRGEQPGKSLVDGEVKLDENDHFQHQWMWFTYGWSIPARKFGFGWKKTVFHGFHIASFLVTRADCGWQVRNVFVMWANNNLKILYKFKYRCWRESKKSYIDQKKWEKSHGMTFYLAIWKSNQHDKITNDRGIQLPIAGIYAVYRNVRVSSTWYPGDLADASGYQLTRGPETSSSDWLWSIYRSIKTHKKWSKPHNRPPPSTIWGLYFTSSQFFGCTKW